MIFPGSRRQLRSLAGDVGLAHEGIALTITRTSEFRNQSSIITTIKVDDFRLIYIVMADMNQQPQVY
jgi:hypothetical protein